MRCSGLTAALAAWAAIGCSPSAQPQPEEAFGATPETQTTKDASVKVGDGPFGFEFGMSIADVKGASPLEKPGFYEVTSPPKSHPDFEGVVLVAYPETGICQIRGVGRTIEGDGSGGQVRAKVDALSEALSTKYGQATKFSHCSGGEIQCDDQFWMMTLDGGERAYGYEWVEPNEAMEKNRIGEIYVAASALNIQASYPRIEFHSEDKAGCNKAEKATSVSSL